MSGQRGGFVRNALHEVAVAADDVRPVIDDRMARPVEHRREMRFGDRHAHGVRDALTQRAGRRLDAGDVAVLGVARRATPRPPEIADLLQREVESGEVENGILEDRGVAGGEHEPVPTEPRRDPGAVPHVAHPQGVRHGGERHRGAGVTGAGSLDGVHGERADRVDGSGFQGRIRARSGGPGNGFDGPCFVQKPSRELNRPWLARNAGKNAGKPEAARDSSCWAGRFGGANIRCRGAAGKGSVVKCATLVAMARRRQIRCPS